MKGKKSANVTNIQALQLEFQNDGSVSALNFHRHSKGTKNVATPNARAAKRQLSEYLAGKRRKFNLKVAPQGTSFQRQVWAQLKKVPYGKTVSYKQLARAVGKPRAVRAVASACGANPIAIVIPCHRVIRSDGSLGGYFYGLKAKQALLDLEGCSIHLDK